MSTSNGKNQFSVSQIKQSLFLIWLFIICTKINYLNAQNPIRYTYQSAVNERFSKLLTGSSFSNIGSYVSLDPTSNALSISGLRILDNGNILTGKITGSSANNALTLISSKGISPKLSYDFNYHRIIKINAASTSSSWRTKKINDSNRINDAHLKIMNELRSRKDSLDLEKKMNEIKSKLNKNRAHEKQLDSQLTNYKYNLTTNPSLANWQDSISLIVAKVDSIQELNIDLVKDSIQLKLLLSRYSSANYFIKQINLELSEYGNKLKAHNKKFRHPNIEKINLSWFTSGVSYKNNTFTHLSPGIGGSLNRLRDTSAEHISLNLAFTTYQNGISKQGMRSKAFGSYTSYGLIFSKKSNFNNLNKQTLQIIDSSGFAQGQYLTSNKTLYSGTFKDNIYAIEAFIDWYLFLHPNNPITALHIRPSFSLNTETARQTSLLIGGLVPFYNKTKQQSRFNLELFYNIGNLLGTSTSPTALSDNSIGLTGTIPIAIK